MLKFWMRCLGSFKLLGMGKMKNYQMITVKEYVDMLDSEVKYLDTDAKELRKSLEKYLLAAKRAATNAKILEALLT